MNKTSIRFQSLRMRLPGPVAWWWLGVRTRWATRSEASTVHSFLAADETGSVNKHPAAYQRLLSVRLRRYLEILSAAAAGILLGVRTTYENRIRRLAEIERLLNEAHPWATGQEPPGLWFTVMPLTIALMVAMPLTWHFAETLGGNFLFTLLVVVGASTMEVFAAERAGIALGKLIHNEPRTPTKLTPKESRGALAQLAILSASDLMLMGFLAHARASGSPMGLWLALGAITVALGLFAGVHIERARPWRRMRKLERKRGKAEEAVIEARSTYDLVTRRIASLAGALKERMSEINERAGVVFARRWRRRHKQGVAPLPPELELRYVPAEIERMLVPLRDIRTIDDLGVNLRTGGLSNAPPTPGPGPNPNNGAPPSGQVTLPQLMPSGDTP